MATRRRIGAACTMILVAVGCGRIRFDTTSDGGAPDPDGDGAACIATQHVLRVGVTLSAAPAIAANATGFGVAWYDARAGGNDIYLARVDDTTVVETRLIDDAARSFQPALAWSEAGYGLAWMDDRRAAWEVYFARFDETGARLTADERVTQGMQYTESPAMAWNGGSFAVVWEDFRNATSDQIYVTRYDAGGTKLPPETLLGSGIGELSATVAAGSNFGVVWRSGSADLYFAHLDATAVRTRTDVLVTSSAGLLGLPAIVWTGDGFGVAWYDDATGNVHYARLDADGDKIGSDVVVGEGRYSVALSDVSIGFLGDSVAIAWADDRTGLSSVYVTRLTLDGQRIEPETELAKGRLPALATRAGALAHVWTDDVDGGRVLFAQRCL